MVKLLKNINKFLGAVVKLICSTFAAVIKTKVLKTAFTGTTPVLEFCKKHQKSHKNSLKTSQNRRKLIAAQLKRKSKIISKNLVTFAIKTSAILASIPVGVTKQSKGESVSFRRRVRLCF